MWRDATYPTPLAHFYLITMRALDKHGGRPGSVFPKAVGNITRKNAQGQYHLDNILTNPKNQLFFDRHRQLGKIVDIKAPNIGGARFTQHGEMIGFLEP